MFCHIQAARRERLLPKASLQDAMLLHLMDYQQRVKRVPSVKWKDDSREIKTPRVKKRSAAALTHLIWNKGQLGIRGFSSKEMSLGQLELNHLLL